jgi:small nuclear ribonucleoprotein (snRNP)-like protein
MKYKLIMMSLLIAFFAMNNPVWSQEGETGPTIEELKGQVDGIDENVNALLTDVSSLKKLKISGYMQVQYEQTQSEKGLFANPYDAKDLIDGNVRIRRSRLKFAYNAGLTQFVIQGDFSNQKFELKDAYIKITDPWTKYFALQAGVFNRPNYEVEYSSSQRESMERSTVIKTLYPGERDMGAMLIVNPDDMFQLQVAAFNNAYQGTYKQFSPNFNDQKFYYMARLTKELSFTKAGIGIDFGVSARIGNVIANTNKVLTSDMASKASADSTTYLAGDLLPRTWYGAEAQIYWDLLGGMKIIGEYMMGSNVDELSLSTVTPAKAIRMRDFSGYYVMLVKNVTKDFQVAVKYDSYNPNTKIEESKIDNTKDLSLTTIGLGLHNYTFAKVRLSLWYDMYTTTTHDVVLTEDPKDNLFTFRVQYKF